MIDPSSLCADEQRRGLKRIADAIDDVDYILFANLTNLKEALRGNLLRIVEVQLMATGAGPTLDYRDATELLAEHQPVVDMVLARRRN